MKVRPVGESRANFHQRRREHERPFYRHDGGTYKRLCLKRCKSIKKFKYPPVFLQNITCWKLKSKVRWFRYALCYTHPTAGAGCPGHSTTFENKSVR